MSTKSTVRSPLAPRLTSPGGFLPLGLTLLAAAAGALGGCSPKVADPSREGGVAPRPQFEVTIDEAFDPKKLGTYSGQHVKEYAYIDQHRDQHLTALQRWLRQPSISAQSVGIVEMAEVVRGDLETLGFQEAEVVPTSGHPGVWGYYDAGAEKTLLIYLMYDVQPVEPEDWESPPFAAKLVERPFGKVLMARGATNQKGPERAFLNAVEAIIETRGTLPVNLMVLAEGEEELGSPHYPELVDRYEERLKTANGAFFPFNSQSPKGEMSMFLGVKGIVYFEIEAGGGDWGGPAQAEIHGSFKATVDSPVLRLVQALASMTTPDGNAILIDGYYDAVRGPTEEEMRLINGVARHYDGAAQRELLGVSRWIDGIDGRDAILRWLYEITLNVDGIWGGYTGQGVKTILPHMATAKVDSRLPPNVDPDEALTLVRAHLDRHGFPDIVLRKLSGYPAAQTSVDAELVQAAIRVLNKWGELKEVWPRHAGSAPFYQFTERLGLPLVVSGLGHGSGQHGPNEYMVIEPAEGTGIAGLAEIEKGYVDLLYALAGG